MTITRVFIVGLMLFALGAAGTVGGLCAYQTQGAPVSEQPVRATPQPAPAQKPAADDFGPEVKGLRARVTLARTQFAMGEAIIPAYVVKNVSAGKITIWHCGFWPNHQVIVRDAAGKEPPLTPFGKLRRDAFAPGGARDRNVPVVLSAGGEDATEAGQDLTKLYELDKPGSYKAHIIYEEKQGDFEVRLPSNEVAFDVLPGPKPGKAMAESKPVRVDAVDFRAVVEPKCLVPLAPNRESFYIGFRLTNQGGKKLLFNLFDTLQPVLKSADGKVFPVTTLRLRTAPAKALALDPMLTQTVWRLAQLEWAKDGKTLRLVAPEGSGGNWIYDGLTPGKYRLSFEYESKPKMVAEYLSIVIAVKPGPGQSFWTGKVTTAEVEFEIADVVKDVQDLLMAPVAKLIADLESADGNVRVAATKELFRRGKGVLAELKQAGAKQIAPFGTIDGTRRLDLVYSLLEGLPPNQPQLAISHKTDVFGLHVTKGTTKEAVAVMGNKHGFTLAGEFRADTRPNCYVKIGAGKSQAQVMQDVLSQEPAVTTLNLNYVESTKKPLAAPAPTVKFFDDPKEVARMKQFYPQGFNFVNAIHLDGKIIWINKVVQGDKVQMKSWQFTTVAEFKKAFVKEMITKDASVEVHLPLVNPTLQQAANNAQQILDFLQQNGYKKAGVVSN